MADMVAVGQWTAATLRSSTPLLLVTLGETLTQRVGIINLGVEGEMLGGACIGFAVGATTGDPLAGLAAGAAAGLFLSAVHAGLCPRVGREPDRYRYRRMALRPRSDVILRPRFIGSKVTGLAPLGEPRFADRPLHPNHPRRRSHRRARRSRARGHRRRVALPHQNGIELAHCWRIVLYCASRWLDTVFGSVAGHSNRRAAFRFSRRYFVCRLHPDLGERYDQRQGLRRRRTGSSSHVGIRFLYCPSY